MDIEAFRRDLEGVRTGTVAALDLAARLRDGAESIRPQAASVRALVHAYQQGGALPRAAAELLLAAIDAAAPPTSASATGPVTAGATRMRPPGATGATTGSPEVPSTTSADWIRPDFADEPSAPLEIGAVLNRRYELVGELGRGGMGVVYKALDRGNAELSDRDPYVAVKVLGEDFKRHPLAVRALQRETRKAQKLAHPNIVTVYDFDRDGGNVFMVMELLEGQPLDELLRGEASMGLPYPHVARLVRGMGAALAHAHEQGIVHSDFKPGNAFVTRDDTVKVVDFGIARAAHARDDAPAKTLFDARELNALSPPYASLEMLSGEPPDPRDDLYALACVTYELLTGRHPFKGIDAAKARDAGLVPAPPRSLPRPAWAALRQALAFERGARTESVAAFVEAFVERPRSRAWIAPVAIGILVAVAAVWVVPGQWHAHLARGAATQLATAAPADYDAAFAAFKALSPAVRAQALQDEGIRRALLERVRRDAEAAVAPPTLAFDAARRRVQALGELMPDSRAIADLTMRLEQASRVELLRQVEQRDRLLEQGWLAPSAEHDSVAAALERLSRIDPHSAALADPRLPAAFAAAARGELDAGRLASGRELVETGLRFAATDPRLLDLRDRITLDAARDANAAHAGEVEAALGKLDPADPGFFEAVLGRREEVRLLLTTRGAGAVARRLQESLEAQATARLRQRLVQKDLAGAQELLLAVGDLLPERTLASLRGLVADAGRSQDAASDGTLLRLHRAVLSGSVSSGAGNALDLYSELQRGGATGPVLAAARDLLAYGYLLEARRARRSGDAPGASRRLVAATDLHPTAALTRMIAVEAARAGTKGGSGEGLAAARARVAASLAATAWGPTEVAAGGEALDALDAADAPATEVATALHALEARVQAEAARLRGGAEAAARLYLRQAVAALPASVALLDPAQAGRAPAPSKAPTEADGLRQALAQVRARAEPTERWVTDLQGALQRLAAVVPATDPLFASARRQGSDVLVGAAGRARAAKRFSEAENLLALAQRVDLGAASIAVERAAIGRERSASDATLASQTQQANVDAVKQRLLDQSAAGDVAGATQTATALRRVLAGSVYVARDVPQALILAYANRARSQVAAGEVDAALKTLADGRQKYGTAPELKAMELRYVAVGEEYDRLSAAVSMSIGDHRQHLDALRAAAGAEYPVIERMLAQTLADRIADHRAAGRATVAAALLESGRRVFPEFSAQLEHGTAGRLRNAPLSVGSE